MSIGRVTQGSRCLKRTFPVEDGGCDLALHSQDAARTRVVGEVAQDVGVVDAVRLARRRDRVTGRDDVSLHQLRGDKE